MDWNATDPSGLPAACRGHWLPAAERERRRAAHRRRRRIRYAVATVALLALTLAAFGRDGTPDLLRLAGVFAFFVAVWTGSHAVSGRPVPWTARQCACAEAMADDVPAAGIAACAAALVARHGPEEAAAAAAEERRLALADDDHYAAGVWGRVLGRLERPNPG